MIAYANAEKKEKKTIASHVHMIRIAGLRLCALSKEWAKKNPLFVS